MPNVRGIMKHFLIRNKFEGLYHAGECGCELDDLMPCGEDPSHCEPGYKIECPNGCGEHNFHIALERE